MLPFITAVQDGYLLYSKLYRVGFVAPITFPRCSRIRDPGRIAILAAIRPRRMSIYLVGLVESVGVEPTIVHVAALPIAYNPIKNGGGGEARTLAPPCDDLQV